MKLHSNSRRILFQELEEDVYGIKRISTNSIPNMIDIGANVGVFSTFIRLLHPNMKMLAIEPHKKTYEELVTNLDHLKIETWNCAFGNGEKFYLTKQRKMDLCNKFSTENEIIKEQSQVVESLRLQDIFIKSKMKPEETLLKIDCEGAESFMVKDKESEEILKQTKFITMEVHETQRMKLKVYLDWFMKTLWGNHVVIIDKHNSIIAQVIAIESRYFRSKYK